MTPMPGATSATFAFFSLLVPRAEEQVTSLLPDRTTPVALSVMIGFLALLIVTGILLSDAKAEPEGLALRKGGMRSNRSGDNRNG